MTSPLNTEIRGDIAGCRDVGRWLEQAAHGVHDAGTSMNRSRSESESCWEGEAGDAFRSDLQSKAQEADDVVDAAKQYGQGITAFAAALDTARSRMRQARELASEAGLTVTTTEIFPPGPKPGNAPVQPPAGSDPSATERHEAEMREFTAVYNDHKAKVEAFEEASQTVSEARERERDAHRKLRDALNSQVFVNLKNYGPPAANAAASTGAAAYTAQTKLAARFSDYVSQHGKAVSAAEAPGATFAQRAQATNQALAYRKAMFDTNKAIRPKVPMGNFLAASAADSEKLRFSNSAPILRKLPYIGTGLTVYTAGQGIHDGKPPAKEVEKAVAGTGSAIAAGAFAGTFAGGPVGAAAGALLGAGLSYGVGKFIDWQGGPVEQLNRNIGIE